MAFNWIESHSKLATEGTAPKRKKFVPIIVFSFTCIILVLFEIPRTRIEMKPVMVLNHANGNQSNKNRLLEDGMNIGFIDAKNKIQTISSKSSQDYMKTNMNNLVLICKGKQQFLKQIARKLQNSLIKLPYVDNVICYMDDQLPDPNLGNPDIFITLKMPEMKQEKFLLNREMQIKIDCEASSSISDIMPDSNRIASLAPSVSFTIQSQLLHISRAFCIECPGTEYKLEVNNISCVLTEALRKQFEILMNKEKEDELPETIVGNDIKRPLLLSDR